MVAKKNWIEHSSSVRAEPEDGVYSAAFYLKDLANKGAVKEEDWKEFKKKTKLNNFYWRSYWLRGDVVKAGGRGDFPRQVDAVVVFLHGWDGSGEIWENIPARLCNARENLLVLVPDVNGFSRSPFSNPEKLEYENCDPSADLRSVELWLEALGILGGRRHVPIILVGHSMSGAALFYLNDKKWENHRVGRIALAPALLMNDSLRKGFYRTLGRGIRAGHQLQLEQLTNALSPIIVNQLISGASKGVQTVHERVFKATDKRTLASTFFAMGEAKIPTSKKRDDFKIMLGHDDRLVGLHPMLDLMTDLDLGSRQVRVVLGDHYFFSVGRSSFKLHQESREITFEEILRMVRNCVR